MVAVYFPVGVPEVVCDDYPPPHPAHKVAPKATVVANPGRQPLNASRIADPSRTAAQVNAKPDMLVFVSTKVPEVPAAVVLTTTVTGWPPLPVSCTEGLDRLQAGGEDPEGVRTHVRFTVPLKGPDGVTSKLKLALCPALTVCEV
jgi:hypothetical protein